MYVLIGSLPFYVEVVYYVFGFLSAFLMLFQEIIEFFSYAFFAFTAENFATSTSAFEFRKFGAVLFKEE